MQHLKLFIRLSVDYDCLCFQVMNTLAVQQLNPFKDLFCFGPLNLVVGISSAFNMF
jgi:hypothetical protein